MESGPNCMSFGVNFRGWPSIAEYCLYSAVLSCFSSSSAYLPPFSVSHQSAHFSIAGLSLGYRRLLLQPAERPDLQRQFGLVR